MFLFNVTDATGAISGMPTVKVYDSRGRLKGFVGPGGGTVTSVGLSMPSGFTVTNSPVTGAGVLTVTGNGTALDYIDGTGAIQTFPTINTYTVDNGLTENPANNFQLGGTLLQNTTITGANFNFTYTGLNRFSVDVDDFVNLVADNGTDSCTIDVSAGGATPYIELNVKNSTINHLITVDDTQILIRTPGVDTASVSNGDVLTLIDATSGEVEFQTPTGATYTVDNGLTANLPTNFQLGGNLITDTTVNGNGNNFQFHLTDLYSSVNTARYVFSFATNHASNNTLLSLDSNSNVSRFSHEDGGTTTVSAIELTGTQLRVQTPAYATATNGDVLTLIDNTTGEAEWQTIPGTALGFQDVLINNSTLTQNNTVLGANFNFTWSGFNRFSIETDQFTSIDSTSGSNTAIISANSLGVAPYVDLNVKNGTDIVGIYLDTNEIDLYTPAIDNSTATAGDVFTLVNAATGEGEWQTPSSGSGIPFGTAAGIDTYTTTIAGITGYTDGDAYIIRFTSGNTTGCTLNINGIGAKDLYRNNDGPLLGGDIWDGAEMLVIYNSVLDAFDCIGTSPNALFAYVTNDDSVTITKGQAVYAFSGTGDRLTVKLAYNTSDATSAQTVGLVASTSIAANQKGIIIMQGLLDGLSILPTATWADGDPVYLDSTAGALTPTKPFAPNHLVYLGFVTTASNGSSGRLYVRVQNGYEMNELHDVQSNGAINNDILYRDTTVSPNLWKPASIPTILGYTPADINSPAFTGVPTAPTAASGTNTTQIATTEFVQTAVQQSSSLVGIFGDGGSGNATITGSLSLTNDAYYNDLTISGAGSIFLNGFRLFVKGTLDISNAGANAIYNNGFAGDGSTGVTAGNNTGAATLGRGGYGQTTSGWFSGGTGSGVNYRGGNGAGGASINTNNAGAGSQSPVTGTSTSVAGGTGGTGGKGGNSVIGPGGAGGAGQVSNATPSTLYIRTFVNDLGRIQTVRQSTAAITTTTTSSVGGLHGGGGGGGGSSTTTLGGGGSAGGGGGGNTIVYARQIVVGAGTNASAIAARGGDGGSSTHTPTTNIGGGGGGAGGGGGYIYLVYGTITGGSYTFASANGGTGGNGGNGSGTGFGGQGGSGGSGGRITAISLGYNTLTLVDGTGNLGTTPAIPTTTTGSAGGAGGTCTFSS